MSVLEAMAYGLPVVATPVGGIPDAVQDGANGFLVEPGDIEKLSNKIEVLIKDSCLREKFGRSSRDYAENKFDISQVSIQLCAIYQRLL